MRRATPIAAALVLAAVFSFSALADRPTRRVFKFAPHHPDASVADTGAYLRNSCVTVTAATQDKFFLSNDTLDEQTEFTISAWVRWDGESPGGNVFSHYNVPTDGLRIYGFPATPSLIVENKGSGENGVVTLGASYVADKWTHIALVYTLSGGNRLSLYIDNDLTDGLQWTATGTDTTGGGGLQANSGDLIIGRKYSLVAELSGCYADLSFWTVAMNASQLRELREGSSVNGGPADLRNHSLYAYIEDWWTWGSGPYKTDSADAGIHSQVSSRTLSVTAIQETDFIAEGPP